MAQKGNVFNVLAAQFYRVNGVGIGVGQLDPNDTGTAPQTSHAYRANGIVTVESTAPEFANWQFDGDGRVLGTAQGGPRSLGSFTLTMASLDSVLNVLLTGGAVDQTTLSAATISAPNINNVSPFQVGIILTAEIQSRDSVDDGDNKYYNLIIPLAQCTVSLPTPNSATGSNPSPVTINVTPSNASRFPNGIDFGVNQNWTNNQNTAYALVADFPYSYTVFKADAAATDYTLLYLPASDDATNAASNLQAIDGAATAPTSVSTTTGVVVNAAATGDELYGMFYAVNTQFALSP